jgi:hypothetical protein
MAVSPDSGPVNHPVVACEIDDPGVLAGGGFSRLLETQ